MSTKRHKTGTTITTLFAGSLALLASGMTFAEYVPFPGKLEVRLLDVVAPNVVFVNFEAWPGFPRSVQITLPGLAVPEDTPQSDDCEREKAARAAAFTRDFLADAKKIYVQDMRMETSADKEAVSPILTDKGSLASVLEKEGLARPDSVDPDTSWCNQE
ncbi:MAG TPA: hypothetical protein ENJ80_12900 [Gammaproteobacteria bacterium]|nr:hypothetical protein [Gammaproteobacteria bacterium]